MARQTAPCAEMGEDDGDRRMNAYMSGLCDMAAEEDDEDDEDAVVRVRRQWHR